MIRTNALEANTHDVSPELKVGAAGVGAGVGAAAAAAAVVGAEGAAVWAPIVLTMKKVNAIANKPTSAPFFIKLICFIIFLLS
jgi:hypothetical protein